MADQQLLRLGCPEDGYRTDEGFDYPGSVDSYSSDNLCSRSLDLELPDSELSDNYDGSSSDSYFTAASSFSSPSDLDDESVFGDSDDDTELSSSSSTKWWSFEDEDVVGPQIGKKFELKASYVPCVVTAATTVTVMNRCDSKDFSEHESGFFDSNGDSNSDDDNASNCELDVEEQDKLWMEFQSSACCTVSSFLPACTISKKPVIQAAQSKIASPRKTKNFVNRESSTGTTDECVHEHSRKVCFKEDRDLVEVHYLPEWDSECRRGPWEECARDRERFQKRIEETSVKIEPCLRKKLKEIFSTVS